MDRPGVPSSSSATASTASPTVMVVPRTNTAVHAAPGQQVYVTVDTGGHMASPAQVYFDQRPLDLHNPPHHPDFPTVILPRAGVIEDGGGGGGKLDALANAASALTPMTSAVSDPADPSITIKQQFQCGECLGSFWSSQEFFDHWLRLHCRPLDQAAPEEDEDDPAALGPNGLPQIRHCERCNHVFVYGMQRFREHSLTCGGGSGRLGEPDDRLEPQVRPIREHPVVSGPPTASVTGTIQHAGMKRHADEGGQRHRVGKGRTASIHSSPAPTTNPGHGALVSCGVCGVAMRTITSFFLHWLDTHSHLIEILEEVWQCGQCSAPCALFPTREGLESHVEREHPFEGRTAFDCGKCASARYATQSQLDDHQRLHSAVRCPRGDGDGVEDVALHFKGEHEVTCMLCKCQIPVEEEEIHLSQKHRFEMVWSRTRSLEKIDLVTQPSKDPVEDNRTKGRPRGGVIHSAGNKRAKVETMPSSKSTDAGSVPSPAVVAGNKTESGAGWRCRACAAFFTSEKLLEKHYFANHEFKCKFCELTMDKDEYGAHLRLHLADERKKAVTGGK